MDEHGLAQGLGWVSIGVGLAVIAAPVPLMKAFGLGGRPNLGASLACGTSCSARGYSGGRT